jgi:hypothetical protein
VNFCCQIEAWTFVGRKKFQRRTLADPVRNYPKIIVNPNLLLLSIIRQFTGFTPLDVSLESFVK